ncbi:TetR/AcrR family transcriptional regulator [Allostreptomyces psammosilenae]|uniref:AcrR family transcriptional regulator n=1 Tax=Allostreptomyces psammosilenae TaxID=1892865 RepID=A0A853A561_9ACTN|nr:TetR/AcrR family transcriptional regulator [Allostreptomyces psammosilenae]NYI05648.1 AcrR family transcriptional regulator [Allostreptomyces psammosilenae]
MAGGRLDGRVERGNQTRRLVLARTVDIASLEGLESLSLGRLAGELNLSKSGVFALFGSKEELQLATVRAARERYVERVVRPAVEVPAGIGRVWRLCQSWLAYSRERVFPGGCFFASVSAEYDSRPGPVRDALAEARRDWVAYVERVLAEARELGELGRGTDVPQLAFEVVAVLEAANAESVLREEHDAYRRAATAIRSRLHAAATDPELVAALPD